MTDMSDNKIIVNVTFMASASGNRSDTQKNRLNSLAYHRQKSRSIVHKHVSQKKIIAMTTGNYPRVGHSIALP